MGTESARAAAVVVAVEERVSTFWVEKCGTDRCSAVVSTRRLALDGGFLLLLTSTLAVF